MPFEVRGGTGRVLRCEQSPIGAGWPTLLIQEPGRLQRLRDLTSGCRTLKARSSSSALMHHTPSRLATQLYTSSVSRASASCRSLGSTMMVRMLWMRSASLTSTAVTSSMATSMRLKVSSEKEPDELCWRYRRLISLMVLTRSQTLTTEAGMNSSSWLRKALLFSRHS